MKTKGQKDISFGVLWSCGVVGGDQGLGENFRKSLGVACWVTWVRVEFWPIDLHGLYGWWMTLLPARPEAKFPGMSWVLTVVSC